MYALVKDGIVVNIVVWDGSASWSPPEDTTAVEVTEQSGPAYIGGTYSNGLFSTPPENSPASA
ncbi:hypothetical protein G5S35_04470 [Paraburkholderia tropica]|uniref:hypothetical protein n=1 Tax=Paraburkholderia tropica TaxID=92647 RepID=UPI00160260B8|nr:hypothetical protein [Paraburkholderia tropica]QNB10899.1 hypothetical protein G5S35_04470 [Paraburkholderia tropica]